MIPKTLKNKSDIEKVVREEYRNLKELVYDVFEENFSYELEVYDFSDLPLEKIKEELKRYKISDFNKFMVYDQLRRLKEGKFLGVVLSQEDIFVSLLRKYTGKDFLNKVVIVSNAFLRNRKYSTPFTVIRTILHEWIHDRRAKMGLADVDDVEEFITETITWYLVKKYRERYKIPLIDKREKLIKEIFEENKAKPEQSFYLTDFTYYAAGYYFFKYLEKERKEDLVKKMFRVKDSDLLENRKILDFMIKLDYFGNVEVDGKSVAEKETGMKLKEFVETYGKDIGETVERLSRK